MGMYKIADVFVSMNPQGKILKQNSTKYRCEDAKPDIYVNISQESINANIAKYPNLSPEEWEYILGGILFYKQLIPFGGMMLHASAVVVDGRAYLFTANPGVGKSTHTKQWLKLFGDRAYIINDDKPAIKKCGDNFYVYGTPFSGKECVDANKKAVLQGICVLEQSEKNDIKRIEPKEAIPVILEQTLYSLPLEQMDNLLALLDGMLKNVPVYKLKCNISTDAAKLSYDTMKP